MIERSESDAKAEMASMLLCVASLLPWIVYKWEWGGLFDSFGAVFVAPVVPWFVLLGFLLKYKKKTPSTVLVGVEFGAYKLALACSVWVPLPVLGRERFCAVTDEYVLLS